MLKDDVDPLVPGVLEEGGEVELEGEEKFNAAVGEDEGEEELEEEEELLAFIPMINLQVPTEGSVVVICATPWKLQARGFWLLNW